LRWWLTIEQVREEPGAMQEAVYVLMSAFSIDGGERTVDDVNPAQGNTSFNFDGGFSLRLVAG
jgi:hypothetical protein